jgi:hypothetical protein
MKSLYFGASLAPRMEQAASQIQDSRDLEAVAGLGITGFQDKALTGPWRGEYFIRLQQQSQKRQGERLTGNSPVMETGRRDRRHLRGDVNEDRARLYDGV